MKHFLILFVIMFGLCSCRSSDDDDDEYYNRSVIYSTICSNGDLSFHIKEIYQYNTRSVESIVVNNSYNYSYSFDYEMQIWHDGILLDSSGIYYIYDLNPGNSEDGGGLYSRYSLNDNTIKIVINNVVKVRHVAN